MTKALQLFPLVYPDSDPSTFKAGMGWLKRFRHRHGVRALSVQGGSLSGATDTIDSFKKKLAKIMEEKGLPLTRLSFMTKQASAGA